MVWWNIQPPPPPPPQYSSLPPPVSPPDYLYLLSVIVQIYLPCRPASIRLQLSADQRPLACQHHHITSCLIKTYRDTSETYHGWALQCCKTNNMEEDMSCLLEKIRWLCAGNGVRCREFLRTCNHIIYNFGPTSANLQQLSSSQILSLCSVSVYHNITIWS